MESAPTGAQYCRGSQGRCLCGTPHARTPTHLRMFPRQLERQAEHQKSAKYAALKTSHHFVPLTVETSGLLGQAALSLVWDLGQRLHQATGEKCSKEYLLQRIAITVQRGNAAAVLGTAWRQEDPFRR